MEIDKYFNYYLIGTITQIHTIVSMYTFSYNTYSYAFPIRMGAYNMCALSILLRIQFQKRVHTPPHTNFNDYIYACWSI